MKTRMIVGIVAVALALPAFLVGCVPDKRYNLEDMDSEITILKGVTMPLPNLQEITLGNLIEIDPSGEVFKINSNGEYMLSFKMEPTKIDGFSIASNAISLSASGENSTPQAIGEYTSIPANTPLDYDPEDKAAVEAYLSTIGYTADMDQLQKEDFLTQTIDYSFDVDFSISDFPKEISAVKSAVLAGSIGLNIVPSGLPFSKILLKAGSKVVFPDFIRLSSCSNAAFTVQENGYTLLANSDVEIPMNTGLSLEVALSGLDFGTDGKAASAGKLALASQVKIENGKITLDPLDFTGSTKVVNYPKNPSTAPTVLDGSLTVVESDTPVTDFKIGYSYTAGITSVSSVVLKLSESAAPSFDKEYGFDITGLPDILSGADVDIELAEIQLGMAVNSSFPVDFNLKGNILSLRSGASEPLHKYEIGPLAFKGNAKTTYSLGEKPDGESGGVIYKHVEGLGKILSPLPDRVEASGFSVTFPNDWTTIATGQNYGAELEVSLDAPLSFTAKTALSLGIDLNTELNLTNLGKNLPKVKAELEFTALNTVPLSFGVEASAYDENNARIETITSSVDGFIEAGTLEAPKSSKIVVTLDLDTSHIISRIRLGLGASSNEAVAGTRLNNRQGLTLSGLSLTLPNGITADIKSLTTNKNQ